MRTTFSCLLLAGIGFLPTEPMEIGTTPQFFVDDYVVDNRWSLKAKTEEVVRVFHAPKKYERNPVIAGECGYASAVREADTGLFKLWYQTHLRGADDDRTRYAIAYAESRDGLNWTRPQLGLHEWKGTTANNIVWKGHTDARASGQQVLQLPAAARRGYRYVMASHTSGAKRGNNGIRLVGSHDGIHWDKSSDSLVADLPSDTVNSIVFDSARNEYVMFCRPKDRYLVFRGEFLDTGESRRIARMSGKELWSEWKGAPQTILIPDELDLARGFNRFYGMPTAYHAGIYWGFLWPFKLNTDIWTELAWSRDGVNFERLPARPRLIDLGPDGAWDDGMVFGSADWIEVGDEWWMFYSGWDGPHGVPERNSGIGLVKLRKEGFVSLRGPAGGGVVCTRQIRWPGGKLIVNADAHEGELKVRVSGERRKPLEGYDYADCNTFTGDSVAHEITWKEKTMDSLKGQVIRIEFLLKRADLYAFRTAENN